LHDIERLRDTLLPFLTVAEYCDLTGRCPASAYVDLHKDPSLAIKISGSTRFVRDRVLDKMARSEWRPRKDSRAKVPSRNRRPRRPRREPDSEARP